MSGTASARIARACLIGIVGLALAESIAALVAYRDTIAVADFEAVAAAIPEDGEVALAADWLGPRARMAVPGARAVGRADLRGIDELWVVDTAWGRGWSRALEADLEGEAGFERVERTRHGGLSLHQWRRASGEKMLAEPSVVASAIEIEGPEAATCRRTKSSHCKEIAAVEHRYAEIDYRARRCLAVELEERHTLVLRWDEVEFGNVLHGHVGFDDFNARLRSDSPAELTIVIDGVTQMRSVFTDDQGWAAFALRTEPGMHGLEVRVRVAARGTWQEEGYNAGRVHAPCIELRTFEEADRG